MTFLNLKTREKIFFYIAVSVIMVFILERGFFSNFRARLRSLHQQIRTTEASLRTAREIQRRKETILIEYEKYRSYLTIPELSDRDRVALFLKEVEKIAQESGVSIVNLNPQNEPKNLGDYKQYLVDLRIEGDVEQVAKFLYNVQAGPLLVKLDNLSVSTKGDQASLLRVETTVSLGVP